MDHSLLSLPTGEQFYALCYGIKTSQKPSLELAFPLLGPATHQLTAPLVPTSWVSPLGKPLSVLQTGTAGQRDNSSFLHPGIAY